MSNIILFSIRSISFSSDLLLPFRSSSPSSNRLSDPFLSRQIFFFSSDPRLHHQIVILIFRSSNSFSCTLKAILTVYGFIDPHLVALLSKARRLLKWVQQTFDTLSVLFMDRQR
ncbi:hypothetical protein QVD17_11983 [Tagetes erecta]|uniref:Uncharacterized protein n=1 Tax=Tagetes erecta TaxID=13708 RepID=A0AAD8NVG0_TARER|nr:hypothetical protein QVD17_11983 [Tagetes erecta]